MEEYSIAKEETTRIPCLDHEVLSSDRMGDIPDKIFAISQVRYKKDNITLKDTATGFFYKHQGKLYFITNRHVVFDKGEEFFPNELILNLHTDKMDLTKNEVFKIPLYEGDDPTWFEHPKDKVDVIALPVEVPSPFFVTPFSEIDFIAKEPNLRYVYVRLGDDLLVVGYPEGLYDSMHNTPIIRRASLASVYPLPYNGKDYFLIDALLHKGTSGSPVLLKPSILIQKYYDGGGRILEHPTKRYLIGIHSGEFDKHKKYLKLHIVYFAELIPEIIENLKKASV